MKDVTSKTVLNEEFFEEVETKELTEESLADVSETLNEETYNPNNYELNTEYDTPKYVYETFKKVENYLKLIGELIKRNKTLLDDFSPEELKRLATVEFAEPFNGVQINKHLVPPSTFTRTQEYVDMLSAGANVGYALVRNDSSLRGTVPYIYCEIRWLPALAGKKEFYADIGIIDQPHDDNLRFSQARLAFEDAILKAAKTKGIKLKQDNDTSPFVACVGFKKCIREDKTLHWEFVF